MRFLMDLLGIGKGIWRGGCICIEINLVIYSLEFID